MGIQHITVAFIGGLKYNLNIVFIFFHINPLWCSGTTPDRYAMVVSSIAIRETDLFFLYLLCLELGREVEKNFLR